MGGMIKLENPYFAVPGEIIDAGSDCQWMKPVVKR